MSSQKDKHSVSSLYIQGALENSRNIEDLQQRKAALYGGYRRQSWNNLYYPIVSYVYIISILLSILAERWFPSFRHPIDIAMYSSNLFLIVYCIGALRKEYQEDKTLNVTTCIFVAIYAAGMFLLNYLLR